MVLMMVMMLLWLSALVFVFVSVVVEPRPGGRCMTAFSRSQTEVFGICNTPFRSRELPTTTTFFLWPLLKADEHLVAVIQVMPALQPQEKWVF